MSSTILKMKLALLPFAGIALSGCFSDSSTVVPIATTTPTASPSPTSTASGSAARAVKFFLNNTSTNGSFVGAGNSAQPTVDGDGPPAFGFRATRYYNPDGTEIPQGTFPAWMTFLEIGISGAQNTAAANPDCARFSVGDDANNNCYLGPGSSGWTYSKCGVSTGTFRVSEVDCSVNNGSSGTAAAGTGAYTDGIYIRAGFDRTQMDPTENILVVLEYASAALDPAPANPLTCFSNGTFSPELCSDFTWRSYLKHSVTEVLQPYLLVVPPMQAAVTSQVSGVNLATKQIFLPVASDSGLRIFQMSRTQSSFPSLTTLSSRCQGSSPLCAGMVFYSITFFRM